MTDSPINLDEAKQRYLDGLGDIMKLAAKSKDERIAVLEKELIAARERIAELDGQPKEGLYGKYALRKTDGSAIDPNADYFILRLDTDPVARKATIQYSYYCGDARLAKDLQTRISKYDPKLEDCISLQYTGWYKSELVEKMEYQEGEIAEQKRQIDELKGKLIVAIIPQAGDASCIRELLQKYEYSLSVRHMLKRYLAAIEGGKP